ncbi:MAG: hypothetical protein JW882_21710 [Deltaproteobacteria bacterium]|nr:hypothetical protein [Deltaproteobacteria bacterium]
MRTNAKRLFSHKRDLFLQYFKIVLIIPLLSLSGCGGGGGSGDSVSSSGNTSNSLSNTGSIIVNLKTLEASAKNNSIKIASNESPLLRFAKSLVTPRLALAALDCGATGIENISANVYDENDTFLVSGGPWPCSAHSGTINNVPVGTNLKALVLAKDANGEVLYWGEVTGLTVQAGVTTDAGTVSTHDVSMSVSDLLANGFSYLFDGSGGEPFKAKTYFQSAMIKTEGVTSNDADTARFFYALTRVGSLVYKIESDGVEDGLNDIGDILDAFGYSQSESRLPLIGLQLQDPAALPLDSPRGQDLVDFLYNVFRPEIIGALGNLNDVSTSFNRTWEEPNLFEIVESDYGDVLFFAAIFRGILANIYMLKAYNLNCDIDETDNNDYTLEEFFGYHPDFLKLISSYSNFLTNAKSYYKSGLNDAYDSILWMEGETDAQDNDYIHLVNSTATEIEEAKLTITDAKNSLDGPTFVNDHQTASQGFTLDMSIFFSGLELRNYLPPISGDGANGLFPDPTFAGIVGPEENLNEDIDPSDGVPDGIPEEIPPLLLGDSCIPPDGSTYDVNSTYRIALHFNERMGRGWSYDSDLGVWNDGYWYPDDRTFTIFLYSPLTSGTKYTITLNPSFHPYGGFTDEWSNFLKADTKYSFTQK